MARVSIPHVAWRDGRPRFSPGPALRRLGFAGEDLRAPDGRWMSYEQALARAAELAAAVAAARAAGVPQAATRALAQAARRPAGLTVAEVIDLWMASPRLSGRAETAGRRRIAPLAAATRRDYAQKAGALAAFDPDLWTAPVAALRKSDLFDLFERLWEAKGLATARGVIRTLSAAIGWAMRRGRVEIAVNPCERLDMQTLAPDLRPRTPAEIRALIAAADALGRPEIGDSVALGVWTGQRQGDRLAMVDAGAERGRRVLRQSKTGAPVSIPDSPELAARLAAMRARRAAWPVQPLEIVVDEATRRRFRADHYRHVFAAVRAAAVAGVRDAQGGWLVPPTPALATMRDKDLRSTAVTWLALAGCTIPEICAITGHTLQSAHHILKHYLALHRGLADAAIRKAVEWYDKEKAG